MHRPSADEAAFTSDLDAFLTGKTAAGATTGYQYSSRSELLQVDLPSGDVVEYAHDPLGRRIAKNPVITDYVAARGASTRIAFGTRLIVSSAASRTKNCFPRSSGGLLKQSGTSSTRPCPS